MSLSGPDFPTPREAQTRPQPKPPTPEQMGFRVIIGKDVLDSKGQEVGTPHMQRIANIRIDNTNERKGRWEQYLNNIGQTALDPQKRLAAIAELSGDVDSEVDPHTRDALDYAKSMIANFGDPTTAGLVLERGARVALQESIARAVVPYKYGSNDTGNAVHSALKLAGEKYYQEHGEAYQTAEQKAEMEKAKERASKVNITG